MKSFSQKPPLSVVLQLFFWVNVKISFPRSVMYNQEFTLYKKEKLQPCKLFVILYINECNVYNQILNCSKVSASGVRCSNLRSTHSLPQTTMAEPLPQLIPNLPYLRQPQIN